MSIRGPDSISALQFRLLSVQGLWDAVNPTAVWSSADFHRREVTELHQGCDTYVVDLPFSFQACVHRSDENLGKLINSKANSVGTRGVQVESFRTMLRCP